MTGIAGKVSATRGLGLEVRVVGESRERGSSRRTTSFWLVVVVVEMRRWRKGESKREGNGCGCAASFWE